MFCCIYIRLRCPLLCTSNLRTDFLCVKSSEDISGGCVFPNVPLYKTEREFTYYFFYLIYLVLNKCVQIIAEVWVKSGIPTPNVENSCNGSYHISFYMELYKLSPSTPLQLRFISRTDSNENKLRHLRALGGCGCVVFVRRVHAGKEPANENDAFVVAFVSLQSSSWVTAGSIGTLTKLLPTCAVTKIVYHHHIHHQSCRRIQWHRLEEPEGNKYNQWKMI
jgi:hypothetical protein